MHHFCHQNALMPLCVTMLTVVTSVWQLALLMKAGALFFLDVTVCPKTAAHCSASNSRFKSKHGGGKKKGINFHTQHRGNWDLPAMCCCAARIMFLFC